MKKYLLISLLLFFMSCTSMSENNYPDNRVTVGVVQKEIKKGMSSASVAIALGSPNIVTSGDNDEEVWIYDKISSNVSYSRSSLFGTVLLIGGGSDRGQSSRSQRTLTIIIKFNEQKKVISFKYHTSRF